MPMTDEERPTADAESDGSEPRNRNRNQPQQDAEHHADPQRYVAELRSRLHRVAEKLAHLQPAVRRELGLAARRRVESRFTLAKMVSAYRDVYMRVA